MRSLCGETAVIIEKNWEGWYSHRQNLERTMREKDRAFAMTLDLELDFSGALENEDRILRSHADITRLLELLKASLAW